MLEIIKAFGMEMLAAVLATVMAVIAAGLRRLADTIAIQGAAKRAEGVGLSAMSEATEGAPVDEGGAISQAHEYLTNTVGGPAKRLGADLGAIAAAAVVGAIARKAAK